MSYLLPTTSPCLASNMQHTRPTPLQMLLSFFLYALKTPPLLLPLPPPAPPASISTTSLPPSSSVVAGPAWVPSFSSRRISNNCARTIGSCSSSCHSCLSQFSQFSEPSSAFLFLLFCQGGHFQRSYSIKFRLANLNVMSSPMRTISTPKSKHHHSVS